MPIAPSDNRNINLTEKYLYVNIASLQEESYGDWSGVFGNLWCSLDDRIVYLLVYFANRYAASLNVDIFLSSLLYFIYVARDCSRYCCIFRILLFCCWVDTLLDSIFYRLIPLQRDKMRRVRRFFSVLHPSNLPESTLMIYSNSGNSIT